MSILCIGQAVYDITFPLEAPLLENQKYRIPDRYECIGAPAANAACLCASWKSDTSLIARIGNDLFGQKIHQTLKTVGVNTSLIQIEEEQPTSISCIIVNKQNGHRTILNSPLKEDPLPIAWPAEAPDVILVDGHELKAAEAALKHYPNSLSVIDAGTFKPELIDLIKNIDYLVCSEDFAFQYSGLKIELENQENQEELFCRLEKLNAKNIVVTIGDRGCLFKENHVIHHFPAFSVNVIDTTGAGDIFHGAFAFGLEKGYPLKKVIQLASAASAVSVGKIGGQTSIPSLKTVEEFIHNLQSFAVK